LIHLLKAKDRERSKKDSVVKDSMIENRWKGGHRHALKKKGGKIQKTLLPKNEKLRKMPAPTARGGQPTQTQTRQSLNGQGKRGEKGRSSFLPIVATAGTFPLDLDNVSTFEKRRGGGGSTYHCTQRKQIQGGGGGEESGE